MTTTAVIGMDVAVKVAQPRLDSLNSPFEMLWERVLWAKVGIDAVITKRTYRLKPKPLNSEIYKLRTQN